MNDADFYQLDLPEDDDAPEREHRVARQPLATPRFCGRCGAPYDPDAGCAACLAADQAAAASTGPIRLQDDRHPVRGTLWFYFIYLSTFSLMLIDPSIQMQLWVLAVDAALVLAWAAWDRKRVLPLLLKLPNPLWFLLAIGLSVLTFAAATAIITLLENIFTMEEEYYSPDILEYGLGWTGVVMMVCVQPAIVEELAYRGIIQTNLGRVLTVREAMIVSSLMFMVMHLTPLAFPHLFLIGMVLAWLRVRTGSLWPGVLMHFSHNLLCVLAEYFWEMS